METRRLAALRASIAALACFPPLLAGSSPEFPPVPPAREERPFDDGWRFHRGDAPGAEAPGFDDRTWRVVDVPHDWSIEELPRKESPGRESTGWALGGTGWYRKRFSLPGLAADRRVEARFDGVYRDADFWLNGRHVGSHPYGYTSFALDLTPAIRRDDENVLAVRVRNEGRNSRWYSGSGIYRHVALAITGPIRVVPWGLHVMASEATAERATVRARVELANAGASPVRASTSLRVLDPLGREVGEAGAPPGGSGGTAGEVEVPAGGEATAEAELRLEAPRLWSPADPHLYRAEVEVRVEGRVVDRVATAFGIRSVEIDAERGLRLNGEPLELRGGCLHHDNGPLGSAAIDRAEERRVEILKAAGYNAVRTAHNPPSTAFLDACDRLGMLVVDEAFDVWEVAKNPEDYHRSFRDWGERDVRAMVRRDRNHPSVILWSIGNEIPERADPSGVATAARLRAAVLSADPERPVTAAVCAFWERPGRAWIESDPAFLHLDVAGYNYLWSEYEKDHARHPRRAIAGTESFPLEAFENWDQVERHPFVIGDFVWTAWDYLGESGIGRAWVEGEEPGEFLGPWPWHIAGCGDIDILGRRKPWSYYREALWRPGVLAVAVRRPLEPGRTERITRWGWPDVRSHWTWPGWEGKPLRVDAYSSFDRVRLLLNGREVGVRPTGRSERRRAEFEVPYEPGELVAIGEMASAAGSAGPAGSPARRALTLRTAGAPAALRLTADRTEIRASRDDLSYVLVELVDSAGTVVPDARPLVRASVSGPGEIAGFANADPVDVASYRGPERTIYQGVCQVILRPTGPPGEIALEAAADGLPPARIAITARPDGARPGGAQSAAAEAPFRPPAVPLVAHDPYFSVWSFADRLTDVETTHWTGAPQPIRSLVRIDGRAYRILGAEPGDVPALAQTSLEVRPTRTAARFEGAGIALGLDFFTPALPDDLDVLARPVTYVSWKVRATDGRPHAVELYLDCGVEIAVHALDQAIHWDHPSFDGLVTMRVGRSAQPVLEKRGDDIRIDWGYAYLSIPEGARPQTAVGAGAVLRRGFVEAGRLPYLEDAVQPRAASNGRFAMAAAWPLGTVGEEPVERWAMLAYDDRYSIRYFESDLRPWWRRDGSSAEDLLRAAARDRETIERRGAAFDEELAADLRRAGGEKYARLCALAYRQCLAANKIAADAAGKPLVFPKENFSNGCIATVDVLYPQAPLFLLLSPTLLRASLVPVLDYASSPRWRFPFAPHDLGTYPHATGQVYGGGERSEEDQMPVEESGNLLVLVAALEAVSPDREFLERYRPALRRWADYLVAEGLDPANQLCTADMFGRLAHNADLSLKAVIAIGAYARIAAAAGWLEDAARYGRIAREYAARWPELAADEGRTRLAFDRPGSWGMKHNLVWDRILGLGLFPEEIGDREVSWYERVLEPYGLPSDDRTTQSLIDWALWCIALERDPGRFAKLFEPIYRYAHETPDRVPLSDWYDARTGRRVGFQARSVVGGLFLRALLDPEVSRKWARRDRARVSGWAPIPLPAPGSIVLPDARSEPGRWRFALEPPPESWAAPDFDDAAWPEGLGGFGAPGTPGARVGTEWRTREIWIRRAFDVAGPRAGERRLALTIHHDEDAEVFLNGVEVARLSGWTTDYETVPLSGPAADLLRPGRNVVAARCRQTYGGQYIDIGLAWKPEPAPRRAAVERNPVLPGYFADPSLFFAEGTFWICSTTDGYGWEAGPFVAWRSENLVDWSFRGLIYPEVSGKRNWAPSALVERGGKYHLFFSKELQIHVAVARSPEGPFEDALGGRPLIPKGFRADTQSIDSEVLVDADGQAYLYWGGGPTYVARLRPDLLALEGEPVRIPTNEKFGYVEGPFPFRRGGKCYLIGAASGYHDYHIIYGISDSPLGPFAFPDDNPITLVDWEEGVWGPGHGSAFQRPGTDEWYLAYLKDFPREVVSPIPRQVAIDRLEFRPDGTIRPVRLTRRGVDPVRRPDREERNLALGAVATASSWGGGLYGPRGPESAVDGTFATRWVARTERAGEWLSVDLGEVREISRSEVFLEFPTKTYLYRIETSLDGAHWEIYARRDLEEAPESPKVDRGSARARHVRVVFGGTRPEGTLPAIWELRVY